MRILFKSKRIQLLLVIIVVLLGLYAYMVYEGFADSKAGLCAIGFWCPAASQIEKSAACPGGTYGATPGLTTPACSGRCKAGCFCGAGSTKSCENMCPAGSYCVEGSERPVICPSGNYCPASSSSPTACPSGVFCPEGTTSLPGGGGGP